MYQFFVEDEQVQQDRICIVGGDVNHIGHVLRMKTGEKIRISDQSGRSYFCRILEITEEEVWAQIEDTDEMGTEFSHRGTWCLYRHTGCHEKLCGKAG